MLLILLLTCLTVPGWTAASTTLNVNSHLATAGYFQLDWTVSDNLLKQEVELQQAGNADFSDARSIYRGRDSATIISGLSDGEYFYRIKSQAESGWSETVMVKVEHHSLSKAFIFFALGAAMFIALLIVLMRGARNAPSEH